MDRDVPRGVDPSRERDTPMYERRKHMYDLRVAIVVELNENTIPSEPCTRSEL